MGLSHGLAKRKPFDMHIQGLRHSTPFFIIIRIIISIVITIIRMFMTTT